MLPADVRDHHAGADRRRVRRAHEVLGHALVHRPVGDLRLFADRALGLGTGRHPQRRQSDAAWVKVLDFAGGTVVHINSGTAGLMAALMLGKRKDTGPAPQHGADLHRRLAAVGRLVRLQCRLGGHRRHAGRHGDDRHAVRHRDRRLHLDDRRVDPCAASRPSSASARARWPGLVAITPASGFVGPMGALAIGVAAGIVCYWGVTGLKHMFGYDDALDAFGVHARRRHRRRAAHRRVRGRAIRRHRRPDRRQRRPGDQSDHRRRDRVRLRRDRVADHPQARRLVIGLRVTEEVEREGLDLALHGEAVQ